MRNASSCRHNYRLFTLRRRVSRKVVYAADLRVESLMPFAAVSSSRKSSSEWIREAIPELKAVRLGNPNEILNELPALALETDYVIADGPGSNTETTHEITKVFEYSVSFCMLRAVLGIQEPEPRRVPDRVW